jgi:hypothetical protein
LALGLSLLAEADPLAAPDPAPPIAFPIATTPPVSGGNASPFYYERFFAFLPALPISAKEGSLSLTALALIFLSDGISGNFSSYFLWCLCLCFFWARAVASVWDCD